MNILKHIETTNMTEEDKNFVRQIASLKCASDYIDFDFKGMPVIDFFKRNEADKVVALYFVEFICDFGSFVDYVEKADDTKLAKLLLDISSSNNFNKILDLTLSETIISRINTMMYYIVDGTSLEDISKWAVINELANEKYAEEDTRELLAQGTIGAYDYLDNKTLVVIN